MTHLIPLCSLYRYAIQGLTSNELSDNRYLLFDPDAIGGGSANATIFGNLDNATNMFLTPGGTDTSPGSNASQASVVMNLLFAASPSLNAGWNDSIIGTTSPFLECGIANGCFVEPVATNFMRCFVINFPRDAPCKGEFDAAAGAWTDGAGNVAKCLAVGAADAAVGAVTDAVSNGISNGISTVTDTASNAVSNIIPGRGNRTETDPNATSVETAEDFAGLSIRDQTETVLCLLEAVLPGGSLEEIKDVVSGIVNTVTGIAVVAEPVIDIIKNGLPGEVILFVFGWAEFQDGELVAPYKWWYCLFAVSMFVVGLEVVKIFGTRFIIWTKR